MLNVQAETPRFVWIQNFCSSQTLSYLSHHKFKAGKGLKDSALLKVGPPFLKGSDLTNPPPTARGRSRERPRLDLLSFGWVIFGDWPLKTKSIRKHAPPDDGRQSDKTHCRVSLIFSVLVLYNPSLKSCQFLPDHCIMYGLLGYQLVWASAKNK